MIDVFSDVHLDEFAWRKPRAFVEEVLPKKPSSVLCFQGDFGYENEQNLEFLEAVSYYYELVLFVLGNNDTKRTEGYNDAGERVAAFMDGARQIPNAIYLNGKKVTHRGITYAGSDIYFDFVSVQKQFCVSEEAVMEEWKRRRLDLKHQGFITDPVAHAEQQKAQLRELIPLSDVILTHAPPNYFVSPGDHTKGFFRFDAEEHIPYISGKTWLFGHQHERRDQFFYGCRFVNASYVGSGEGIVQLQVLPALSK